MNSDRIYQEIMDHYREVSSLSESASLLQWDLQVNMPPKGLEARAEQNALLERLVHEFIIRPDFVEKVETLAQNANDLTPDENANLREIKRQVDQAIKVPKELVEAISRAASMSHGAWVQAREKADFSLFAPHLNKMVDLQIEKAQALGFGDHPYDGMIDLFEPGTDEASIKKIFDQLREQLVPFIHSCLEKPVKSQALAVGPEFDPDKQKQIALEAVKAIGFDFEAGRQDTAVHPFCSGTHGDVRITTRFYPNDLRVALFGMMHEAGHGMYEQNLNPQARRTPLGESVSMAVHESQSRLWENIVGRSLPFCKYLFPKLQEGFPKVYGNATAQDFYEAVNVIEGSLIRVEADEATYQLHIILRFEIESDLINRRITLEELPQIWNEKMKSYLGVDVPDDGVGVLQDVHWSEGYFGYFPTYCLGNLYSAQIYQKAASEIADLPAQIEQGQFDSLRNWLIEKIYSQGKRYGAAELVEKVTGQPPTVDPFMKYLQEKFGPLYGL